ncbi:MAG: NAD(P)-dependent oxidoreductase [Candidatus Bathyarchaeota archaeon]|nr:MAG: NAD(P)-dependent oxidoreductase [Candidatus Bathyarchaeota archaeon]
MNQLSSYEVAIIGAGFVGSTLAKYLCSRYKVVTFDINPIPSLLEDTQNIEHRTCDISNYHEVEAKLGAPKVIVHTAIIQIPAINQQKDQAYQTNIIGTHNICRLAQKQDSISGLILCGSWHVFGEREYKATVDAAFGYRPDKVEERARLYVISKMLQEGIVRFHNSMIDEKTYGIVRLGTVLGDKMPPKTAANIFITNGLQGKPITPYKHTMHRPMLYVAIDDICKAFQLYIEKIIKGRTPAEKSKGSIYNLFHPQPITILELAQIIKESIINQTQGHLTPKIEIVDKKLPALFSPNEKETLHVDIKRTREFFGIEKLKSPETKINEIVRARVTER